MVLVEYDLGKLKYLFFSLIVVVRGLGESSIVKDLVLNKLFFMYLRFIYVLLRYVFIELIFCFILGIVVLVVMSYEGV